MGVKGILLYSGGLDSLIAAKLLMDQGIEMKGINFILPFVAPDINPKALKSSQLAEQIGLPLVHVRCGKEYMEIIKDPPHGHGKNINPCIDCKIYFIRKAGELMKEENAAFVATGEVVGQRPMSQLKQIMRHIEKQSGIEGRLLRPLSAKKLPPTIPEKEGLVDRSRLLEINGRGRKEQMELAERYGISDYESPAGGCLFTDRFIAERVRDLLDHNPGYSMTDVYLLSIGRHFRLHGDLKIIIARNEHENGELLKNAGSADCIIEPYFKGPAAFLRGPVSAEDIATASSMVVRYGKPHSGPPGLKINTAKNEPYHIDSPAPVSDSFLDTIRI
ncbi:MAG TPA: hypothetical protein PKX12_06970 [Spirochaetota bacterium]|nr:hypothetical protein [Spirochaetota bacterium]